MFTRHGMFLWLVASASSSIFGDVVINEIHYHPKERGSELEFVELLNTANHPVRLDGWMLEDAVAWTFPPSTVVGPGEFVLVAQDPQSLKQHYGAQSLGPWKGKLDNNGEKLTLVDASGMVVDEVDYARGFPWPTLSAGGGASMELIHPGIDNDLAGSWRASLPAESEKPEPPQILLAAGDSSWRYHTGSSAPSRARAAWRTATFDDSKWKKGQSPIGYGDGDDRTVLRGMRGNYSTVYLRNTFELNTKKPIPDAVTLKVYSDDGAVVWINGVEVARFGVAPGEPTHRSQATRNHEAGWETVIIKDPRRMLRPGKNAIAAIAMNASLGSSDLSIDVELRTTPAKDIPPRPSPGATNLSAVAQPPPQIRQVKHDPTLPTSGKPVMISAKVTDPDGVATVRLLFQVIPPGSYLSKADALYETQWTSVVMQDNNRDDVYEVSLPADIQVHRRLVRYLIEATDVKGSTITVPYKDDSQSNFAYFCYDGTPAWKGSNRPGKSTEVTFDKDLMNQLPAIHLIARNETVDGSQYHYEFNEVFQSGALVVGDRVFDHIRFRNRGETTTYMVGKNKWRFNFNRTHEFNPNVLDGRSETRRWKRLNLNPGTVPYFPQFRGNASLNERLAFRIYQLAGIPAPDTAHVQLRVVDGASERGNDQYSGDLWGLYMAFEAIDGFFLDNHGEPDGQLHRIAQFGNSVERPPSRPTPSRQSFEYFWSRIRRNQSAAWWRANTDLERYYSFHAVSIATSRTDQKLNHNHFLYRHPKRGWLSLPWDTDQCLRPTQYDPDTLRWHPFLKNCLQHASLRIAYQNRARELLDLLFTKDQMESLVDELIRDLGPPDKGFPVLDQFLWNYHPRTTRNHRGTFLLSRVGPPRHRDGRMHENIIFDQPGFAGRVQYYKDFLTEAKSLASKPKGKRHKGMGFRHLREDAEDPEIPQRPIIRRIGDPSDLRFQCSSFKDPQGGHTFAGLQWRLGEIYNPTVQNFKPGDHHRYEVTTVWSSPIIKQVRPNIAIPRQRLSPGRTYRVRARHLDTTGRWSHWSNPITLVAPKPDIGAYLSGLVISEIMYHPTRFPDGQPGPEFIELTNVGDKSLDLRPLRFKNGIEHSFADSQFALLKPGDRKLIVSDVSSFKRAYPDSKAYVEEWDSGKLRNGGERLTLFYGEETVLIEFQYGSDGRWPTEADGRGRSLELIEPSSGPDAKKASSWKASSMLGGSPGT